MPRLRRADCSAPGITRVGAGRGFFYRGADGQRITDDATLRRIAALAIPPAWRDVWICADERGHLQATGVDAAGRTQYRYHDAWRAQRDRQKFDRMLEFAASLPALRTVLLEDLRRPELPRERALACAVRLLDLGFFRIGSDGYASQNGTYGVATLQHRHVRIGEDEVIFDYTAKGGQRRIQVIVDDEVQDVIERLKRRRGAGHRLLAFKDGRRWRELHADDVNGYLQEHAGACSAKDFRTWNGTVLAAISLAAKAGEVTSRTAHRRAILETVKEVSTFLGNTPAVARSSYIDPRVFDRFDSGWTIAARIAELGDPAAFADPRSRLALEEAVVDLIHDEGEDSPVLSEHETAS